MADPNPWDVNVDDSMDDTESTTSDGSPANIGVAILEVMIII